jgi:hypothetical protein
MEKKIEIFRGPFRDLSGIDSCLGRLIRCRGGEGHRYNGER